MDLFRTLPATEQIKRINALTEAEAEALVYDWSWNARPSQMLPDGNWIIWLIMAGRGFGKTRTGAETVRQWVKKYPYVNLIGATLDDARDIMIEGESGILAICPKDERPRYVKRQLHWPNGAKSLVFTADEPERLRGKQHMKLWADELGAWRYPESWDQASLGLRLGDSPQAIVTTTPKPTKIVKDLVFDPTTFITRGSTYDNRNNLAQAFLKQIINKYEGTRLGRQELHAELLTDNPGALWKREQIELLRVKEVPQLNRIVVAIDPAVTSEEESDETGISVAGLGADKHGYILEDASMRSTPDQWARKAVQLYHQYKADRIIGETNNGGDMIETIIRTIDPNVPYKGVHASRGKMIRAEPISALYEQGKVHHVGMFAQLEDQMCDWDPATAKKSPDRMDALVWALTELMTEQQYTGVLDYYANRSTARREEKNQ
jgi:phage terminase large subunit-like protein